MSRSRAIDDEIVLDRAVMLFWQRGYAATSIRDLSVATGLSAAALYHRYHDKDGLFVEALSRYADEGLIERLARLSDLQDPLSAISGFLDELIDMSINDQDRRGCFLVNTVLDGAKLSPAARDMVRKRLGEVETFFRDQLRRAQNKDGIDPEIDPGHAAEALLGTVLAIRVMARLDPDPGRLRRLASTAVASLTFSPRQHSR